MSMLIIPAVLFLLLAGTFAFLTVRWILIRSEDPRSSESDPKGSIHYGSITVAGATLGLVPSCALVIAAFSITLML